MKPKILIICFNYLHKDPRVLRQVWALENQFEIETIGFSAIGQHKNYDVHQSVTLRDRLIKYGLLLYRFYKKALAMTYNMDGHTINGDDYEFIICNDVDAIPLGLTISKGKKPIWADLHEFAPREFEDRFLWRVLYAPYKKWLCRKNLPSCSIITNVCKTIEQEYAKDFGVKTHGVITNAPAYQANTMPQPTGEKIRIIHHGGAMPNRNLHQMVEMMQYLDDSFELNMMLVCNNDEQRNYLKTLKDLSASLNVTVNFKEPVPTTEIASTINQYDIGLFILPPINFNWKYALPNKIFEYIQARLAIAISPNPEMKDLVEQYDLGVVANDYTSRAMADSIKNLSKEQIQFYKAQCHKHAQELSFDRNKQKMIHIAKGLAG